MTVREPAATAAAPAASVASFRALPDDEYEKLRSGIRELVSVPGSVERRLRGAVTSTLATPGSLWRAQLAWATARAEGLGDERALSLACAVEAFHVASLLFDDLPAMDDAELRRGKPCVHRVHGESAAILAALAFVHEGHARLARALDDADAGIRFAAREVWGECLGLRGILDGQARDLRSGPEPATIAEVLRRAAGKSAPLLRLALELPATVAGASGERRSRFRELADCLGLAYQLLDDLEDAGKAEGGGRSANACRTLGVVETAREAARQLQRAREVASELGSASPALAAVLRATIGRLDRALVAAA